MLQHLLFLFDVVRLHPYSLQLLIFFLCPLFLQHLVRINVFLCYILYFLVNLCILVLSRLILFHQMLLLFLLHHILETLVYFCICLCIGLFHFCWLILTLIFLVLEILVSLTLDIVRQICLRIQFWMILMFLLLVVFSLHILVPFWLVVYINFDGSILQWIHLLYILCLLVSLFVCLHCFVVLVVVCLLFLLAFVLFLQSLVLLFVIQMLLHFLLPHIQSSGIFVYLAKLKKKVIFRCGMDIVQNSFFRFFLSAHIVIWHLLCRLIVLFRLISLHYILPFFLSFFQINILIYNIRPVLHKSFFVFEKI